MRYILLALVMFISGCDKTYTPEYLLQHPKILLKEFAKCQGNNSIYCDQVISAGQEFTSLTNEQRANPEAFGRKLLEAEQKLGELKAQKDEAGYQKQLGYVKTLLAVIAESNTPGL